MGVIIKHKILAVKRERKSHLEGPGVDERITAAGSSDHSNKSSDSVSSGDLSDWPTDSCLPKQNSCPWSQFFSSYRQVSR